VRSFDDIQQDQAGRRTLRNLATVLQAKLDLLAQYGAFEYDAGEEGLDDCSRLFRELAEDERLEVSRLLSALADQDFAKRFGVGRA
jgi:rubrerythrin